MKLLKNLLLPSPQESSGSIKSIATRNTCCKAYLRNINPRNFKSFWKAVKFLSKRPQSVPTLVQDGTTAATHYDKANLLTLFFHSCFNTSHLYLLCPMVSKTLCVQRTIFALKKYSISFCLWTQASLMALMEYLL